MEQFDLEKYLKNPSRKIITRDGKSARIICTNRLDENYPVLALVNNEDYELYNSEERVEMMQNFYILVGIFLYGFIIVISLIGITNIFNTITTSMQLRRSEFATLKSIGMTTKEFSKMIRLESIFMTVKSLIVGIILGTGLSVLIYHYLASSDFSGYKLPIIPIIISIMAVYLLITLLMKYSLRKINKQNIIETIRNENI